MNHLRELMDKPAKSWLIPGDIADQDAFAIWGDVQKFGTQAQCFWLGEVEDTDGLQVIPELCRLPYDVCWFEVACTTDARHWTVGALIVATPTTTRMIGFRKLAGTWELRYVTDMEKFSAGQMWTLPAEQRAADEAKAVRLKIAAFLSALHCSNVRRQEHAPDAKLQKARAKRGKAPLFSYWTLQLDGKSERGADQGGTHASPRVHLRRGHPRQYAPGKWTWVQAHAVGNKASGVVHKDYSAGPALVAAAR